MRHPDQQTYDEHPEVVKSEPVPVPAPPGNGTDDAIHADTVTADEKDRIDDETGQDSGDDATRHDDGARAEDHDAYAGDDDPDGDHVRVDDEDRLEEPALRTDESETVAVSEHPVTSDERAEFHDPAPVPTAFGATSVGGAVAASALASGDRAAEPDPRDETTVRPGDGALDDGLARSPHDDGAHPDETVEAAGVADPGQPADTAVNGSPVDPYGVAAPTETLPAGTSSADDSVGVGTSSQAVDNVLAAGHPDVVRAGDDPTGPAATTPDGELLPGEVPAEPATTLLAAEAAQGFRDRWRDVQLRFVDDPRVAAGEAQGLVEEAIESLAAALAAQKDDLGGWQDGSSGDTEQLRVVVRRYRDFLDKMLAL